MSLPELDLTIDQLLHSTTIIYGSRGSGKSTVIKYLLNEYRKIVNQAVVVSPTERSNNTYKNLIRKSFIFHDFKDKTTGKQDPEKFMKNIYQRQEQLAGIMKKSEEMGALREILSKLPRDVTEKCNKKIEEIEEMGDKYIAEIEDLNIPDEQKDAKIKMIMDQQEKLKLYVVKVFIKNNVTDMKNVKGATEKDETMIRFLFLNANFLLIFDDCSAELKKYAKTSNAETLTKIFYNGRHPKISFLMSCQDEVDLPPNIKKNCKISIFTSMNHAQTFFERASSGISKSLKSEAARAISEVFGPASPKYTTLIYMPDTEQKFYKKKFPIVEAVMFGPKSLHDLCDMIESKEDSSNINNPYNKIIK